MRWSYRLRNRMRWKDSAETRRLLTDECLRTLETLGVDMARFEAFARAALIEVTVPWRDEAQAWEARIFPWEFVLSAATRKLGRSGPLTIVRHLDIAGTRATRPALGAAEPRVLFVESAPGPLRDHYDFDSERRVVHESLSPCRFEIVTDPSLEDLRAKVRRVSPDLIHLAGFDTHQAKRLLADLDPTAFPHGGRDDDAARSFDRDGYVLCDGRRALPLGAEELGAVLRAGARPPLFAGFNLYDSALRIAALAVAAGAGAAVGFRDLQDDALMELFFARFYRGWRAGGGDPLAGFQAAWEALRAQPRELQGTSVVLWGRTPVIQNQSSAQRVTHDVERDQSIVLTPEKNGLTVASVEVQPKKRLNYALLHNQRSLFERFLIHKYKPGRMQDVTVEVELMVGAERLGYRSTIEVVTDPFDLSREVRIPLAWSLARELHESVRTTMFVDVRWQGHVLKRDTLNVCLLPVSEWRDTPHDDRWLPSFVLPRDPAVLRVVQSAQRYLVALDDDPGAGFDGYQSGDPDVVDRRVAALWHALTQDLVLGYIDPPPAYSPESQRVRTPSEVLNGGRGTCIDLALLFASCLEFVDLYPVLFLLNDHAFPGYWRDEGEHDRFADLQDQESGQDGEAPGPLSGHGQIEAWYLGRDNFDEVRALVHAGKIVPLETVDLTARTSFRQAIEDVREYFHAGARGGFSSMLDIGKARKCDVTPLPFPEGPVLDHRD